MEVAAHPFVPLGLSEPDAMDIDIDMDLDEYPPVEEEPLEEGEEPSDQNPNNADTVIPAIYTEDPQLEPQPEKVHIRGLDELHTNDILSFANDHFTSAEPSRIQWIDDTSANIVYPSKEIALQALLCFLAEPTTVEAIEQAPLELRPAKSLASRPQSTFQVRVAAAGDRKKKNARDASRYYLLHPDQDPTERMRKEFEANGGRMRKGDHGDYQRNRYDDREQRRRRDKDLSTEVGNDFSASMYDDTPEQSAVTNSRGRDLFSRIGSHKAIGRRRSASPTAAASEDNDMSDSDPSSRPLRRRNGYRERPPAYSRRDPHPTPSGNVGKELFSAPVTTKAPRTEGTLHSDTIELFPSKSSTNINGNSTRNAAAAKRLRADLLSSTPTSPGRVSHRRSHAMDAKNDEDLSERFARKSLSIDSTKSASNIGKELFAEHVNGNGNGSSAGLNIRGAAAMEQGLTIKGTGGISIKGRAADVKELFPTQYNAVGKNVGKELFDQPVRERRERARADDWY